MAEDATAQAGPTIEEAYQRDQDPILQQEGRRCEPPSASQPIIPQHLLSDHIYPSLLSLLTDPHGERWSLRGTAPLPHLTPRYLEINLTWRETQHSQPPCSRIRIYGLKALQRWETFRSHGRTEVTFFPTSCFSLLFRHGVGGLPARSVFSISFHDSHRHGCIEWI